MKVRICPLFVFSQHQVETNTVKWIFSRCNQQQLGIWKWSVSPETNSLPTIFSSFACLRRSFKLLDWEGLRKSLNFILSLEWELWLRRHCLSNIKYTRTSVSLLLIGFHNNNMFFKYHTVLFLPAFSLLMSDLLLSVQIWCSFLSTNPLEIKRNRDFCRFPPETSLPHEIRNGCLSFEKMGSFFKKLV